MAKTTQTSKKAGVKSSAKKIANSRYGGEPYPATHAVGGAFGEEPRKNRTRVPGTATPHKGKGAAASKQHAQQNSNRRRER